MFVCVCVCGDIPQHCSVQEICTTEESYFNKLDTLDKVHTSMTNRERGRGRVLEFRVGFFHCRNLRGPSLGTGSSVQKSAALSLDTYRCE